MSDTTNIDVETTFHDDSHDFGGTAKLEARGSSDHLYMANWNCVVTHLFSQTKILKMVICVFLMTMVTTKIIMHL